MAKILILGGTGAIGKYVVNELAGTGHSVFVTSRAKRENYKNINYLQGDAKQLNFLNGLCKDSYDCIVDFMHWGTEEFKKASPLLLGQTGHYVFLSSYRVYADADMAPLGESSPLLLDVCKDRQYLETDEYALAKARCERLLLDSNYKNYTILRPAITFSTFRFQLCTLEADLILPRSTQGKPLILARDMMDKRAAISWAGMAGKMIAPLLLRDEAKCEIFNIGTMESHTWKTIAGYYHELLGSDYVLVDTREYINLGFSRYQAMYDRLYNRIIDNHKILDFLAEFAQPVRIPPLWESLKHEISRNRSMEIAIAENVRIGNNMDKYIVANIGRINPVYGDHFQLLSTAKKIQKLQNEDSGAKSLIKAAEEFIAKNDTEQALKVCESIRQRFPQNSQGYFKAHDAYCKAGDFAKAGDILEQGMKRIPNEIMFWIVAYNLAFSRKDYSKALDWALDMSQKFPNVCSGYFRAASAYTELGEFDKAEEAGRRGVEITPDAIVTWLPYAEVPMRQGNYKLALERFAEIRKRFPNEVAGYTRAAEACFFMGDLDQTFQYCEDYLKSHPDDNGPRIISFNTAMHKKDYTRALEISHEMIEHCPNWCSGYFRAATVYMELEEFDKAEAFGRRAVELTPDAPVTWLVYADIPMRQGNYELALERLAEIREKFPNELAGYTRAAHACKKLGDFNKAREICELGMKIDDNAFEVMTYTIAEIMAQAPEDYFSSIDYLNGLYEKLAYIKTKKIFYSQLSHSGILLAQKFKHDNGKKYFNLILKLFLSDEYGENCTEYFLTFLTHCGIYREEYYGYIDKVIEYNKIFNDFAILIYRNSSISCKKNAIYNILHCNSYICALQILYLTHDYDDYKKIINDIIKDKDFLKDINDYGLFILLNLYEWLSIEKKYDYTDLLMKLIDNKSDIYRFLEYRNFNLKLLKSSKPNRQYGQRLRVAVCISGQLRGYKDAFKTWSKVLKFEDHDTSFFVHTWRRIGRKLPNNSLFYPRLFKGEFLKAYQKLDMPFEHVRRYYKNFYSLLIGDNEIEFKELETLYNTKNICIDDETEPQFKNFNNTQKMHYKIYSCYEFLHQPMQNFDLVIRIRPDFDMSAKSDIDLRKIYEDSFDNNIIYTISKYAVWWTEEMVFDDNLAIGAPHVMNIYARTYIDHYKLKNMNLYKHRENLSPHLSLSYQLYAHGIGMKTIPIPFRVLEPSQLDIRDIYNALKKDVNEHQSLTFEDKVFIEACEIDLAEI